MASNNPLLTEPREVNPTFILRKLTGLTREQAASVEISDAEDGLIMVRPKDNANLDDPTVSGLPGFTFSTAEERVVRYGIKHPISAVVSEIDFNFTDLFGIDRTLDPEQTVFAPFFQGVHLTTFLYNGKMYITTNRRIDPRANNSRWADHTPEFMNMWDEAGGLTKEELYGDQEKSNIVHLFYLIHPSSNTATLLDMHPDGFIRYDGFYSTALKGEEDDEVMEIQVNDPEVYDYRKDTGIFPRWQFTLDDANYFLSWGHVGENSPPDERLSGGESLNVLDISTGKEYHVMSKSYYFRQKMYETPNLYMEFVHFTQQRFRLSKVKSIDDITSRVPIIKPVYPDDVEEMLQNKVPLILLAKGYEFRVDLSTFKDKSKDIGAIMEGMLQDLFLVNAAPYYVDQIKRFKYRLRHDMVQLIEWLQGLVFIDKLPFDTASKVEKRIHDIMKFSRDYAVKCIKEGKNIGYHTNKRGERVKGKVNLTQMQHKSIKNLIYKENPVSLYQLIRYHQRKTGTSSLHISEPQAMTQREWPKLNEDDWREPQPQLSGWGEPQEPLQVSGWGEPQLPDLSRLQTIDDDTNWANMTGSW